MSNNIWVLSDLEELQEFLVHFGNNNDATEVAKRTIACKLLKKIAEYDQRVQQAVKDDMFPLDPIVECESEESSDRRRAPSHPELPTQPLLTPGQISPDGIYRNRFGRRGKELHSEVILKQGIMHEIGRYHGQILPAVSLRARNFVVVDSICDSVMDIDTRFVRALQDVGVQCMKIVVPSTVSDEAGETSTEPYKNHAVFTQCVNTILFNGVSKHSCVISVGGGVVNNLCGVLAGLIYRGIHLVHFTTTTMGMLDAAMDFKQAINHDLGKNLLGCYYPAEVIVIDPACCQTLSARHIRNGIAEALKHGLCQSTDLVSRIVEPLRARGEAALFDADYIEDICKAAIEIKVPTLDHYLESDFNEMCPQYAHAIGHAVEALSWTHSHVPLLHGEAVAIGMCVSAEIAHNRGYCTRACVEEHYRAVLDLGLPAHIPATMTADMILQKIAFDKHYVNIPSMGLAAAVGEMACDKDKGTFAFGVKSEELVRAVEANMSRAMYCYPC
jgi:3-dehydroquinate synthase